MIDQLGRGPASVSELGRPLSMSLAAVVQHVQVLEECGLVVSRKAGRVRTCSLAAAPMRAAEEWLAGQRAVWEQRLDRLDAVLDADSYDAGSPG